MFDIRAESDVFPRTHRRGTSLAGFTPLVAIVALPLLFAAIAAPGLADDTPDLFRDQPPKQREKGELDKLLYEALEDKGEGAKLSPQQVIALLEEKYHNERNTREWEMLNAVGQRAWEYLARRVARKYPEAMRRAATGGSSVARKYRLILGELGGKENLALLIKQCDANPSRTLVLALGRTNSREAWPALRRVMNQPLVTDRDLVLAYLALETLSRAGDKEILPTMTKWLHSDDAKKHAMVMRAAALLGAKEFAAELRKADSKILGDGRKEFYRAIVSSGDDKYLDEVHAQARDASEFIRRSKERSPDPAMRSYNCNYTQNYALNAIAKLGSPRSLPVLDNLAKNTADKRIRKRAAAIAAVIRKAMEPVPREK